MKKECPRTYKHLKKQSVLFVNITPSCSGNQDTTHLREFAIFVSYPGLIENTKSGKLDNLIFVQFKTRFKIEPELPVCNFCYMQKIKMPV